MLVVPRERILPTSNRLLGGKLEERLRSEREKDTSYEVIARIFDAEFGIAVTANTVRTWDAELVGDGSAA